MCYSHVKMSGMEDGKWTGKWTVRSTWKPLEGTDDDITLRFPNEDQAVTSGRQTACCAGALTIQVRSPDGALRYKWNRENNLWLEV